MSKVTKAKEAFETAMDADHWKGGLGLHGGQSKHGHGNAAMEGLEGEASELKKQLLLDPRGDGVMLLKAGFLDYLWGKPHLTTHTLESRIKRTEAMLSDMT